MTPTADSERDTNLIRSILLEAKEADKQGIDRHWTNKTVIFLAERTLSPNDSFEAP